MDRYIIYIFSMLLVGCGYNHFDPLPEPAEVEFVVNSTIEDVWALYRDSPVEINNDVVVEGYVTSTDQAHNFYRTFTIQNDGYALEIKAGFDDLHSVYRLGQRVVVKLLGLRLGKENGVLQIGLKPPSSSIAEVDYFGLRTLLDGYVYRDVVFNNVIPRRLEVSELEQLMCGSIVEIERLRCVSEEVVWAVDGRNSYSIFETVDGQRVAVYVSGYANFANQAIPLGQMTLRGILQYGKILNTYSSNTYILKLRTMDDVISDF